MKIPKIIHYCWFGEGPLPKHAQKCLQSWSIFAPDYTIMRWDEQNFDVNFTPFTQAAHEAKKYAFVSDVARLHVVYQHGGIYLDVDVELLKPMDELLAYDAFFAFESAEFIATGLGFGSVKQLPLLKQLLENYEHSDFKQELEEDKLVPCPQRDRSVFESFGVVFNGKTQTHHEVIFLEPSSFNPKSPQTGKLSINMHTLAIHHYDMSWMSKNDRRKHVLRHRYHRIFGGVLGDLMYRIHVKLKS